MRVLYLWIPTLLLVAWWIRAKETISFYSKGIDLLILVTLVGITYKGFELQKELLERGNWRFVFGFYPIYLFAVGMFPHLGYSQGHLPVVTGFISHYSGVDLSPEATPTLVLGITLAAIEIRRRLPAKGPLKNQSRETIDILACLVIGGALIAQFAMFYWFPTSTSEGVAFDPEISVVFSVSIVFATFLIVLFRYHAEMGLGRTRIGLFFSIGIGGFAFSTPYLRSLIPERVSDIPITESGPILGLLLIMTMITLYLFVMWKVKPRLDTVG